MNRNRTTSGGAAVRPARFAHAVFTLLLSTTAIACGDAGSVIVGLADVPVSITISMAESTDGRQASHAEPLELDVGQSTALTATAFNALGHPVRAGSVVWSSSDPEVISVAADGIVTAVSPGAAEIVASVDDVEASLAVLVEGEGV